VLLALSTWHKIGLASVAAVFILFALASSFLFPRYRPNYPAGRLGWFIVVTVVLFIGMLVAVDVFGRESEEKAGAENEPTTSSTPPTATTAGGGGGAGQTVQVSEKEFKISLPSTTLKPGSYTFKLSNDGDQPHDLTIEREGVSKEKTPVINGGQHATLKAKLTAGEYDFYCSVPGHKQLGMDVKVKVA
jgi:plastocyanin